MIKIIEANLLDPSHQRDLIATLNAYALDPMGGGQALPILVLVLKASN